MNSAVTGRFGGERTSKNVDVEKSEERHEGGIWRCLVKAEGNKTVFISTKRRNEKITGADSTKVQPAVNVVCVCVGAETLERK